MGDPTIRACPECGHPLRQLEHTAVVSEACWECEGPDRHQFSSSLQLPAWLLPEHGPDETGT